MKRKETWHDGVVPDTDSFTRTPGSLTAKVFEKDESHGGIGGSQRNGSGVDRAFSFLRSLR